MDDVGEEDGWGSEYDNENQDDDDDTAWKVRKGAVKLIGAIISACAHEL